MKHDYMTDRNWKLDDLEPTVVVPKKSFKTLFVISSIILLIAIAAAFAVVWHHHRNHEVMAQAEPATSIATVSATTNQPPATVSPNPAQTSS
ncbi:MAG: hypothetical protein K0S29_489 [Gammaproteobacteria bacterium]|jgi:hypothetical protein|nr:hypothetical protein [Gammaproteobacteria bacterium]